MRRKFRTSRTGLPTTAAANTWRKQRWVEPFRTSPTSASVRRAERLQRAFGDRVDERVVSGRQQEVDDESDLQGRIQQRYAVARRARQSRQILRMQFRRLVRQPEYRARATRVARYSRRRKASARTTSRCCSPTVRGTNHSAPVRTATPRATTTAIEIHYSTAASTPTRSLSTLADVAMYYYERDLHPSLSNGVPTTARDTLGAPAAAFTDNGELMHQHMKTFTVAIGLEGTDQSSERSGRLHRAVCVG